MSLAADWGNHLRQDRRRSLHTVRAYVATAERLCDFLQEHRGEAVTAATLQKLEAADLRAFLAFRRGGGLGNASAARELSAVKGFLAFAGRRRAAHPGAAGQARRAAADRAA